MAKQSTVQDVDFGWARILRSVHYFNDHDVYVGINENNADKSDNDGISVAGYGSVHEFGSDDGIVPARPWLRPAVDANIEEVGDRTQQILVNIYDGKSSVKRDLNRFGLWGVKIVKDYIMNTGPDLWPDLMDETIDRKGSTRMLIDHRVMFRSITYVIKNRAETVTDKSKPG